jgi:hypothetical protein
MTTDAVWYIDEGVPGSGPRPDYLQPHFKSLAEQARSYPELRKALGAQSGAPEKYDVTEFEKEVELTNPHLQEFLTYAKENKFSQEAVSRTLKSLVQYENSYMPDETAEVAKLGPDGEKRRAVIEQWAKNTLTPDSHKVFAGIPKTADVLKFMDEMRQKAMTSSSNPPIPSDHQTPLSIITEADVRQEMRDNYDKYLNNPKYREEIERKLKVAVGEG